MCISICICICICMCMCMCIYVYIYEGLTGFHVVVAKGLQFSDVLSTGTVHCRLWLAEQGSLALSSGFCICFRAARRSVLRVAA